MIGASRRRQPEAVDAAGAFGLHLRMARRSSWSRRLMRGSLLALVASFVALFTGVAWLPHLLICLLAFVIGLALPVPGGQREALAEIRGVTGLSYETALGLLAPAGAATTLTDPAPGRPPPSHVAAPTSDADPYGFQAAVIERARLSVRDVRPKSPPAWWLPALAVALALLLFGLLERPSGLGASGGVGGPGGGGAGAPLEAERVAEEEPEPEAEVGVDPEVGRAQEPQGAQAGASDQAADSPTVAPPAEGDSAAAPLSRFLDSLRERPNENGADNEDQGAGGPSTQEQEPPDPEREAGGRPGERGSEPLRAEVDSSGEEGGEPSESGAEPEGGEGQGEGGAGEDSQSGQSADDQGQGDQTGEGEQPQEGGAGQEAGGEPGEAPVGQAGDELDEGDSEFQGGGADGEDSEASEGGGAGAGGGIEQAAGVAEGEQAPPDFLEGVLEAGPENPAGTVRLPGDTEVTLPAGRSVSDYQNATEDAISEGDIPLSYQEIIRRYFR